MSIKNVIKPELTQGGGQLPLELSSRRDRESLADSGPYRRSHLGHFDERLIVEFIKKPLRIALLDKSGRGADIDTLPASGTDAVLERHIVCRHHHGLEAAMGIAQGIDLLYLRTYPDTPAAENALVRITHDRGRRDIFFVMFLLPLEVPHPDPHGIGQPLQFAITVAFAGMAIHRMIVQYQLHDIAARAADLFGIGVDFHPLPYRVRAGGDVIAHPRHLDDTHATGAFDGELGMITQPGYMETEFIRGLHDSLPGLDLVLLVIYVNGDHDMLLRTSEYLAFR